MKPKVLFAFLPVSVLQTGPFFALLNKYFHYELKRSELIYEWRNGYIVCDVFDEVLVYEMPPKLNIQTPIFVRIEEVEKFVRNYEREITKSSKFFGFDE